MAMSASAALDYEVQRERAEFLTNTCWCVSCYCCAAGVQGPCPIYWQTNKCLCIRSVGTTGEQCCGDLGCCSGISKFLCCMSMFEFPPDPLMVGVCGKFCIGGEGSTRTVRLVSPEQYEQMAWARDACWLLYCCCCGLGCVRPCDPLVKVQAKFLCMMDKCETTDICDDQGCCASHCKVCCLSEFAGFPPTMTPGIGLCGMMACKNVSVNPEVHAVMLAAAPTQKEMS